MRGVNLGLSSASVALLLGCRIHAPSPLAALPGPADPGDEAGASDDDNLDAASRLD